MRSEGISLWRRLSFSNAANEQRPTSPTKGLQTITEISTTAENGQDANSPGGIENPKDDFRNHFEYEDKVVEIFLKRKVVRV